MPIPALLGPFRLIVEPLQEFFNFDIANIFSGLLTKVKDLGQNIFSKRKQRPDRQKLLKKGAGIEGSGSVFVGDKIEEAKMDQVDSIEFYEEINYLSVCLRTICFFLLLANTVKILTTEITEHSGAVEEKYDMISMFLAKDRKEY